MLVFLVSNVEVMQSQLKNIYTTSCATLCPLPWLEKAGDVHFNFDDVFIPLRTIEIDIEQKAARGNCDFDSCHATPKDELLGNKLIDESPGSNINISKLHRTHTTRY